VGQWRQLTIDITSDDEMSGVLARFHAEHQRAFAFKDETRPVEVYAARVVAKGIVPKPKPSSIHTAKPDVDLHPFGYRKVFYAEAHGYVDTPLYRRETLGAGTRIVGPAIVEQLDSTVVLSPGTESIVTDDLHIVTRFTGAAA
jgi:N-methylhydantoinase A